VIEMSVKVIKGDITKLEVQAIVNPANSLMIMGGGVAGAIKRRGGDEIEKEAMKFAPVPVGKAIITHAGKLKAKYVIHTPTMEQPAMRTNMRKVIAAIKAALRVAMENNIREIAFPGMGTGVGGLSASEGAKAFLIAFREAKEEGLFKHWKPKIILVAFSENLFEEFRKIKNQLLNILEKKL